jgi:enamine deaminase RidA (YjgF/YER057c/UK114 family)
MKILHPSGWSRPKGFSYGIAASGRSVFVSGMVGSDSSGKIVSGDFAAQVRQTLTNIVAVLAEASAKPEHIVRMTWYLLDKKEYIAAYKQIGGIYREIIGRHYPAMTAIEVAALVDDKAKVEIEATAIVPE